MKTLYVVNFFRWMVFLFSLIGFGCHLGQCLLLVSYQQQASIINWVQAGHWQYLTWWVVLGLSLLSSSIIVLHAFCFKHAYTLRGDKILAAFNLLPLSTSIVTAVLFVTNEPWTNGTVPIKRTVLTDLIIFCQQLDSPVVDHYHPLLYQRCILSDSTWIASGAVFLFWIFLLVAATQTKVNSNDRNHDGDGDGEGNTNFSNLATHNKLKEPHWGRYIPEPVDHHPHFPHLYTQQHHHQRQQQQQHRKNSRHSYTQYNNSGHPFRQSHISIESQNTLQMKPNNIMYSSSPPSIVPQQQPLESSYYYQQEEFESEKVEMCNQPPYAPYYPHPN